MQTLLAFFSPESQQLAGLTALILWCLVFIVLGTIVPGRPRLTDLDLACGFGLVTLAMTVVGVATDIRLNVMMYALIAISVPIGAITYRRDRRLLEPAFLKIMLLGAPLILLVTGMLPSQWDEFTTWLPNARFLFEHDAFPSLETPNALSGLPAYPYGMPMVTYLVSRATGDFVENASALFNVVLTICLALSIARMVTTAHPDGNAKPSVDSHPDYRKHGALSWAACALGALWVTALNPTFVGKLVFTAYSDPSTAALLGLGVIAMIYLLESAAEGDRGRSRRIAWQFALIAAALINIRQANLVLFVALLAGTLLVAWRDPKVAVGEIIRQLAAPLLLPLLVYASWRLYVAHNFTGGEFTIQPLDKWHLDLFVKVVGRMALIASKKGGYFGIMLIALVLAIRALPRVRGRLDRLAIITASVFLLYNGFLLFTYIAAFGEYEAVRAASYWRYNTHLGGLSVIFAAFGAARIWNTFVPRRLGARLRWLPVPVILLLPFAFAHKIRFDVDPAKLRVREVGEELARVLQPQHHLVIMDETHNGEYAVILRYALRGAAEITASISAYDKRTAEALRRMIDDQKATHLWVHVPTRKAQEVVGVPLGNGASYLLTRDPEFHWRIISSWPMTYAVP